MIERACDEISWCNGSKRLWPIRKNRHLQPFATLANGIRFACLLCVIQRSRPRGQFHPLLYVSGSRGVIGKTIHAESGADEDGLAAFLGARARLFRIAYRVLKNSAEAEDVMQDVWIRWQTTDRSAVRDVAAFLATTTMRLAINVIHSARWRRETDIEPLLRVSVDTRAADLDLEASRSETLRSAVIVLLEKLSPAERAAYVLREAFDYSYREIANILRVQEANARQLVTRARRHVADGRHAAVNSAEQWQFLAAFAAAAREGTLTALESFLAGVADGTAGKEERPARTGSAVVATHCNASSWPAPDTAAAA